MKDITIHIDHDTLAAYAMDALTSEEVVAIGGHLQTCTQCQQEIASFRATVGLLPYGLVEAEPPVDLRERIISAAKTGRPVPARAPVSTTREHPMRWGWLRRFAPALMALTFVIGLLFGRVWPAGPGTQPQPEGQVVTLSGQASGSGTVLIANDHTFVRLTISGLPQPAPGQVYQLWLLGRTAPISAGTFSANPDGSGQFELNGLAWSPEYNGIAITIEPIGGNPAPTSDIVAKADL